MKYIFVVNPISGGSSKTKLIQDLNEFCVSNQLDFSIRHTAYAGHAKEIASEYFNAADTVVVAVGGDGTVNEVATSLIAAQAVLHVIPCGSGNGFARYHQVPLNHLDNLHKMLLQVGKEAYTHIDACYLNEIPFFNVSGIGFDAYISEKFSQIKGRGFGNYIKAVAKHYRKARNVDFSLSFDGKEVDHKAFFISFANTTQFGNDVHIAPEADNADGLLDVVVVSKIPLYLFPMVAFKLFRRIKILSKYVKYYKTAALRVSCKGQSIHVDGEPIAGVYDEAVLKVRKEALKVLRLPAK